MTLRHCHEHFDTRDLLSADRLLVNPVLLINLSPHRARIIQRQHALLDLHDVGVREVA